MVRRSSRRVRLAAVSAVVAAVMAFGPAVAIAHPVSEFGLPNCFGERISHGSSDHQLTPKARAALLQELVDEILAGPDGDEKDFVMEFFGETVSVQEFIRFVKLNCSDAPLFLPFL